MTILLTGADRKLFYRLLSSNAPEACKEKRKELIIPLNENEADDKHVNDRRLVLRTIKTPNGIDADPSILDLYNDNFIGALITYNPTSENFPAILKVVSNMQQKICIGCIMLIMRTTNPGGSKITINHITDVGLAEFQKLSSLNWETVREVFRKLVEGSKHMKALDCFSEPTEYHKDITIRRYMRNVFTLCTDPVPLVNEMKQTLERFAKGHYVKFPSIPVVDMIHVLLHSKRTGLAGKKFTKIVTNEKDYTCHVSPDRLNYSFPIPDYIMKVVPGANYPPIIFITKPLRYNAAETEIHSITSLRLMKSLFASELSEKPASNNSESEVTIEPVLAVSNSDRPTLNKTQEKLTSKFYHLPPPWKSFALSYNPNLQNPKKPANAPINGECENAANSLKRKHDEIEEDDEKSEKASTISESPSISSSGSDLASELVQFTTINERSINVVQHSGDKLLIDLVIWCPDITLCRYLTALFWMVHLDEIMLIFMNCKSERKVPPAPHYTFRSEKITDMLQKWWSYIMNAEGKYRKIIPVIQTRFCEYLDKGWHNIAITCSLDAIKNIKANCSAALCTSDYSTSLDRDLFSQIVILPKSLDPDRLFLYSVSGLSKIIDSVLKSELGASLELPILFKNNYYKVRFSLICLIPFYILRSVCTSESEKNDVDMNLSK